MKQKRNIGIILSYIYLVLNTLLSIFISAFIVRTVGKTNYGVHQSMTAFLSYLVLLEFGTGTLMTRNLSLLKKDGTDDDDVKKNISTIWSLTIVLSIIILFVALVFWLLIPVVYSNSMSSEQIKLGKIIFIFAAGNTIFSFLCSTLNGLLLAYEKYLFGKVFSILKLLLRVGILVIILTISNNVLFISLVDFSLSLIVFIFTVLYCIIKLKSKLTFRYFDKIVFKSCIPLAFAMLLQTLTNVANGSVDKFCISIMLSPDDVSIYSISMTFFTMFSSVATVPITMFMPTVAKHMKSGLSNEELTERLIEPCRFGVMITGLIMGGFFVVGKPFLCLLYGSDFEESWIYAMIVIIPMFFNMSNGIIINVLDILNKRHVRSIIMLCGTLLNVLLTIFGIKFFGMIAASIATAISLFLQVILLNVFYQMKIGIRVIYLFHQSYKGIVPFYVIAAVGSFALTYLFDSNLIKFLVGGFIFVVVSLTLVFVFGLTSSEKIKRNMIFNKLFKKR